MADIQTLIYTGMGAAMGGAIVEVFLKPLLHFIRDHVFKKKAEEIGKNIKEGVKIEL